MDMKRRDQIKLGTYTLEDADTGETRVMHYFADEDGPIDPEEAKELIGALRNYYEDDFIQNMEESLKRLKGEK